MKISQDVYESLRSPITFPFIQAVTREVSCCGGLQGEGESWLREGVLDQGEMLIMVSIKETQAHASRAE